MVQPWYKQFWPWFLIALPLTVVVGTLYTVFIFSQNSVSLVAEDYYKKGKGINVDISKVRVANELNLSAQIKSSDGAIIISFNKGDLEHYPALNVAVTHRTLADRDFNELVSASANGEYRLALTQDIDGPWFIELSPHNHEWLIQGRVSFPTSTFTPLAN
jgi:hypothetical protein